ncbi:MAG TPA: site-specific integrase [Acidobacteriaceae bacterium]|nr:site-specific integrase [Acidobacteriaceae bacterium]
MPDPKPEPKKVRGVYEDPKGSGIWWCQHFTPKRHRERVGRKSDAIALYTKRRADYRAGIKMPQLKRSRVTVGELIDLALDFARENGRLMRNYKGTAELLRADLGKRPAEDVRPADIADWIRKRDVTPATFNRYRSFLSVCYREGQRNGKVTSNPARLLASKREPRGRDRFLDRRAEYPKVLRAMQEQFPDRVRAFIFSIYAGARIGEQFHLHWPEINFNRREITFLDTKNFDHRTIPMNSVIYDLLLEMREERTSKRGLVFGDLREFSCLPGAALQDDVAELGYSPKWFKQLCVDLEIDHYTWHNNRHTFCSWLAIDGASVKEIQELAGHKDIKTSARYAHLSPDSRRATMERMVTPLNAEIVEIDRATGTADA